MIFFNGADMTPETDDDPRSTLASPAPAAVITAARDASRAGTVVPVALGLMLGIAYLGYAHLQRQIEAQHAGFVTQLQPVKQKIQEMTVAQSQADAEIAKLAAQSPPSRRLLQSTLGPIGPEKRSPKSEIQGLQNHVDNFRGQAKKKKK